MNPFLGKDYKCNICKEEAKGGIIRTINEGSLCRKCYSKEKAKKKIGRKKPIRIRKIKEQETCYKCEKACKKKVVVYNKYNDVRGWICMHCNPESGVNKKNKERKKLKEEELNEFLKERNHSLERKHI